MLLMASLDQSPGQRKDLAYMAFPGSRSFTPLGLVHSSICNREYGGARYRKLKTVKSQHRQLLLSVLENGREMWPDSCYGIWPKGGGWCVPEQRTGPGTCRIVIETETVY